MKNIVVNFTDAYGLAHTDAVVEVSYANKTCTEYETIGDNHSSQSSTSITMQYRYWHSAAAREAGRQPLPFVSKAGQASFGVSPAPVDEISDLEDYCLAHFEEVILKDA